MRVSSKELFSTLKNWLFLQLKVSPSQDLQKDEMQEI